MYTASPTASPALLLFRHVFRTWGSDKWGHSWTRLNGSLSNALELAISAGLRWDIDDFGTMMHESSGHIPGDVDSYHAQACRVGNKSAANSIDAYQKRKAIKLGKGWTGHIERLALKRVYVGYGWHHPELGWLTVTSIAEDGESVVACSYEPGSYKVKTRRHYTRDYFNPPTK